MRAEQSWNVHASKGCYRLSLACECVRLSRVRLLHTRNTSKIDKAAEEELCSHVPLTDFRCLWATPSDPFTPRMKPQHLLKDTHKGTTIRESAQLAARRRRCRHSLETDTRQVPPRPTSSSRVHREEKIGLSGRNGCETDGAGASWTGAERGGAHVTGVVVHVGCHALDAPTGKLTSAPLAPVPQPFPHPHLILPHHPDFPQTFIPLSAAARGHGKER
ncbi:hypothetical protein E2C01_009285 [Portunus trituberculatus]|uniref:Uncharacterized protein n=1 Tax=Portunus trituberculatus TaxID=210409 RepID=A0A5B7D4S5_PORTR|nr:hypothetical protein [Portunus trituberculatus]